MQKQYLCKKSNLLKTVILCIAFLTVIMMNVIITKAAGNAAIGTKYNPVKVSSWAELKTEMAVNNTSERYIVLSKDITNDGVASSDSIISCHGLKTLDLNGHKITGEIKNDNYSYLIFVDSGRTNIINSSSLKSEIRATGSRQCGSISVSMYARLILGSNYNSNPIEIANKYSAKPRGNRTPDMNILGKLWVYDGVYVNGSREVETQEGSMTYLYGGKFSAVPSVFGELYVEECTFEHPFHYSVDRENYMYYMMHFFCEGTFLSETTGSKIYYNTGEDSVLHEISYEELIDLKNCYFTTTDSENYSFYIKRSNTEIYSPSNNTTNINCKARFSCEALGATSYEWIVSSAYTYNENNIISKNEYTKYGTVENTNTGLMSITPSNVWWNDKYLYCKVYDPYAKEYRYSKIVQLTVNADYPDISNVPDELYLKLGDAGGTNCDVSIDVENITSYEWAVWDEGERYDWSEISNHVEVVGSYKNSLLKLVLKDMWLDGKCLQCMMVSNLGVKISPLIDIQMGCEHKNKIAVDGVPASCENAGMIITKCKICDSVITNVIVCPAEIVMDTESFVYTGNNIEPIFTVFDQVGKKIDASNFTYECTNNVNAGDATITITFDDDYYTGKMTAVYTISPKEIYDVSLSKDYFEYDGKAVEPKIIAKDDAGKIIDESNYSIKYIDNDKVGTAYVEVVFSGNYKGTIKKSFVISKKLKSQKITTAKIKKIKSKTLKKKSVKISLKAKADGKGKLSYKITKYPKGMKKYIKVSKKGVITFKKNAKKGTYKVTITAAAKGDYKKTTKVVTIKVK